MSSGLALVFALGLVLEGPALSSTPAAVLRFAREHEGKSVGSGQCTDLVRGALRHAGLPGSPYGDALPSLRDLQPGDILEFEDAEFRGRSGRGRGLRTYWFQFPHHVAIVEDVQRVRGTILVSVLHQNAGTRKSSEVERGKVQRWTLNLAEQTRGSIQAYRPVAPPEPEPSTAPSSDPAPEPVRPKLEPDAPVDE